jgi:hypothetical protein
MHNLNSNKKNNSIVTTSATLFTLAFFVVASTSAVVYGQVRDNSFVSLYDSTAVEQPKAPAVVSGDNIYIAWWTNNTENGNEEVMFRASTDGGETFSDKINLSNTTDADSWRVEIAAEGDTVVVSWWETANQTNDIPVARISTDAGETFGPMIMLATNGTISSTEEEGDEGETVQDAVEEAAAGEGGG